MSSIETTDGGRAKFKRNKRKKSFLSNAKGFGKKGSYGRGTNIEDDQYNYFINILEAMKNGFEDAEEKVNMANNVFEQTREQEVELASNQVVSKALEFLLGFTDAQHLERYFSAFGDNFRPICSDPYASHVLQKMTEIAFLRSVGKNKLKGGDSSEDNEDQQPLEKRAKLSKDPLNEENYNLETEFTQEHKTNCGNFVLRVGKYMLNNLEDFVWDTYASHIMRSSIFYLSGIYVPKTAFKKSGPEVAKDRKVYEVPDEWREVSKEFAERLEMWPQFKHFPYEELSSVLLSVLCIALKQIDKKLLKHLGKKILMESFLNPYAAKEEMKRLEMLHDEKKQESDPEKQQDTATTSEDAITRNAIRMPEVFMCQPSIVLLETLLTVAGPKLLTQLYAMLFAGRLARLAKEALTNFAVQKLLANIKEKEDFESIFEDLKDHIEELLKIGHTGVISCLSAACLRLQTKQSQLIAALQTAMHINDDKERSKSFFLCLLKLKPFEILQEDKSNHVNLHGSLVIQDILRFNKPIFMVNCILETSPDYLVTVFNTPNGSHICDVFLQSKFIGEKSREKLLKRIEGFYVDLAITKFGSRVVESCFAAANDEHKARIVKELAGKINMLKGSPFGKLISQKLCVDTFRLSAAQWKTSMQKKESKAQQLFKDLIE